MASIERMGRVMTFLAVLVSIAHSALLSPQPYFLIQSERLRFVYILLIHVRSSSPTKLLKTLLKRSTVLSNIPRTFDELWNEANWTPIKNCPGRFKAPLDQRSPIELSQGRVERYDIDHFDPVYVVRLELGNGLISYAKEDGRFIHTLCNADGFARKLRMLGISTQPPN